MSAGAVLPVRLPHTIPAWVAAQRWYQSAGAEPALTQFGEWGLPSPEPGVELVTHLLLDSASETPTLYQVPLSYRSAALADAPERAFVGTVETAVSVTSVFAGAGERPVVVAGFTTAPLFTSARVTV